MTRKQYGITRLIRLALARAEAQISELENETNPQLIELRTRAIGRREAYQNVLLALTKKDMVWLRIAAGQYDNQGDTQ